MNTWMIGKNLMKYHYLRKKLLRSSNMEHNTDADYTLAKGIFKDFKMKH